MKIKKGVFDKCMSCVGPLGNLMFYFQAYEIFVAKSSGSVSLLGFSISVIALTSWLLYGIFLKNIPLVIANVVGLVGALLVMSGIIAYSVT